MTASGMIVAGLKDMPMTASPNFLTLHIVSVSFRAKGWASSAQALLSMQWWRLKAASVSRVRSNHMMTAQRDYLTQPGKEEQLSPFGLDFDLREPGDGEDSTDSFLPLPSHNGLEVMISHSLPRTFFSPRNYVCSLEKLCKLKNKHPCICFPFSLSYFFSSITIVYCFTFS